MIRTHISAKPRMHYFEPKPAPRQIMTEDDLAAGMAALAKAEGHMRRAPTPVTSAQQAQGKPDGIKPSRLKVLKALQRADKRMSKSEIAKSARVSLTTVADAIRDIRGYGFEIERTEAPHRAGNGGREAFFRLIKEGEA